MDRKPYQLELMYPQIRYGGQVEDFYFYDTWQFLDREPIFLYNSHPSGHTVARESLEKLMEVQWRYRDD